MTFPRTWMFVVAARPNFMKVHPILKAIGTLAPEVTPILVHTGQHYDVNMSDVFFSDLGMQLPDEHLGVSGGTHAEQTARTMIAFEEVLDRHSPEWLVVVGDVNSTLACTLVATKKGVPVAHVEAGLRSGDMTMPEEVNRRATDAISSLLLTPSPDADENLLQEGHSEENIAFVGNVMIDSLLQALPAIESRDVAGSLGLNRQGYLLATLHRPSNVDDPETLAELLEGLRRLSGLAPVVFPVHPRTRARIESLGADLTGLQLLDPLGYLDFTSLMRDAYAVVTDSGGVQEETTFLRVPCVTVRKNTERPVTISEGTNRLIDPSLAGLLEAADWLADRASIVSRSRVPLKWDGFAGERVVQSLLDASARIATAKQVEAA